MEYKIVLFKYYITYPYPPWVFLASVAWEGEGYFVPPSKSPKLKPVFMFGLYHVM